MFGFVHFFIILLQLYPATMRPSTLNLRHQQNHDVSRSILREAYKAWSNRSDYCVVPEHNIQPLFYELKLFPTEEQVHDMIRTAKHIVRNFNNCSKNGLTFGEFSVLLSDIRKLRHASILSSHDITQPISFCHTDSSSTGKNNETKLEEQCVPSNETVSGPDVFLGGSCNPTTWRADVAIPTLKHLKITFFNPQVSEWTPDLLELEHRAKEKAKVLFFVMDSQTRSAAGAIEVAHIAGRNSKHLVLVLLPYKQNQKILNDTLTMDEYMDLSRNQQLLKQLVRRRGLPVLDKIPLALDYIKKILSGGSCREQPQDIATRLKSVWRTFESVAQPSSGAMNLTECQTALINLGYPPGIATISIIKQILTYFDEICQQESINGNNSGRNPPKVLSNKREGSSDDSVLIKFDTFCVLDSYLSVLQQEILETSCVSPIKGTNLQQPPIYLTDLPEWSHRVPPSPVGTNKTCLLTESALKNYTQNNHLVGMLQRNSTGNEPSLYNDVVGASSSKNLIPSHTTFESSSVRSISRNESLIGAECNDSSVEGSDAFSSGSKQYQRNDSVNMSNHGESNVLKTHDVFLGGSCWTLTNWRQNYAIPYLKSQKVTYYVSNYHEGLEGTVNFDGTGEIIMNGDNELIFNPAILDASKILLFVITNQTRSLGAMTMAAHYMGLGYNIVLCVQMLTSECTINGIQLSSAAIKDYNRGRAYLVDLAKRQHVPVFDNLEDALKIVVEKSKLH